jgi:hypothetical protein
MKGNLAERNGKERLFCRTTSLFAVYKKKYYLCANFGTNSSKTTVNNPPRNIVNFWSKEENTY